VIQSDIKEAFDKWDIKGLAIVCDDHFVFVNLVYEILQVLSLDIGFNLMAVIKGKHRENIGVWS
jgi:hypothetical protein